MTEQKLKELLADMTLEEKVNQMSQVVGAFFNKDMDITAMGPMADKGFTPENVALSGSVLGTMGAETLKKIQKDFVEQHPHHIPMLFMLDVINGFKTIFPIPLQQLKPEIWKKFTHVTDGKAALMFGGFLRGEDGYRNTAVLVEHEKMGTCHGVYR